MGRWYGGTWEQRAQAGVAALERVTVVLGHGVSGWSRWRGCGYAEAEASSAVRAWDGDSGDVGVAKVQIRSMYGVLRLNWVASRRQRRKLEKRSDAACFLLTGRSGGSDRMLPPSVRSISERSKSSGIVTGRVRWTPTGHSQSLINSALVFSTRPDAETPSDRTLKGRVRSLLRSKFTSCELTGRWTSESSAASGHSFPANLQ